MLALVSCTSSKNSATADHNFHRRGFNLNERLFTTKFYVRWWWVLQEL